MSDERRIGEIEDMLREAGAPPAPPAHYRQVAREAALGGGGEVSDFSSRARPSGRVGRLLLAAAVLTASAAAALVIGVGGNRLDVAQSIDLRGVGTQQSASAVINIGHASGSVRQLEVRVSGLDPAPNGGYYELWMQNGNGDRTGLLAFDTSSSGHVVARTAIPSAMAWTRCWVTVERPDGTEAPVLQLA